MGFFCRMLTNRHVAQAFQSLVALGLHDCELDDNSTEAGRFADALGVRGVLP